MLGVAALLPHGSWSRRTLILLGPDQEAQLDLDPYKADDAEEVFERSSPLLLNSIPFAMSQQYTHYNSSHPELDKADADQLEHSASRGMPTLADWSPYVPDTDEEKRLVRKIDKRLLPMLWVMYVMNYIDRTNIGVSTSIKSVDPNSHSECQGRRNGRRFVPVLIRILLGPVYILRRE